MQPSTFRRDQENPLYTRAMPFIKKLIQRGVPLSAIDTNDFNSSYPAVYITREYGRNWGGRYKKYHAWNSRTLRYAVSFYRAVTPNAAHGHRA
jgi:hypothetical protein